jgi:drug/metabolite transporter (DMT)-like permease
MLSVVFGLCSALTWGAADFFGGLASRRAKPYLAVLYGEVIGLAVLLVVAWFSREAFIDVRSWLICTFAGSFATLGLLLFFYSMTRGKMSVAAPASALMAAFLPVVFGMFLQGFPGWLTVAGILLALAAILLIAQTGEKVQRLRFSDVGLPLLAGISFGVYFILIHYGAQDGFWWPMVSSRFAGTVTMILYVLFTRQTFLPTPGITPIVAVNGILDVSGNAFYILALQAGRLDVASVLASLYPGGTVILARLFLHERLNRLQTVGVFLALAAIILMTI